MGAKAPYKKVPTPLHRHKLEDDNCWRCAHCGDDLPPGPDYGPMGPCPSPKAEAVKPLTDAELKEMEADGLSWCLNCGKYVPDDEAVETAKGFMHAATLCVSQTGHGDMIADNPEALCRLITDLRKARETLLEIAQCKGMTLLGQSDDHIYIPKAYPEEERAHEIGACKAFNQCAAIAKDALPPEEGG